MVDIFIYLFNYLSIFFFFFFLFIFFFIIFFLCFNATFSNISAASRVHHFCNLQSRVRTHAVLVIGLYEFLGNPTT